MHAARNPDRGDRDLQVRPATPADARTIAAFNRAMALETEKKSLPEAVADAGVTAGLGDPHRARYFLATLDGQTVGQAMVTWEWSDWRNGFFWWIQSVYVSPAHRRRGAFRALHEHIREQAVRDPEVCGLRLYVHRDNRAAIETYGRLGMSPTEYLLLEEDWSASRQPSECIDASPSPPIFEGP